MDAADVAFYARLTALASSVVFTGALAAFTVDVPRGGRPSVATRAAFMAFVGVHTIHFLTVLWLAQVSGGQNVRDAGGWTASLIVAALFYSGSYAILGLWRRRAAGEAAGRPLSVVSHLAVVFIGVVFLSSYVVRALSAPGYVIPVAVITAAILAYLRFGGWRARSTGSGQVPARV